MLDESRWPLISTAAASLRQVELWDHPQPATPGGDLRVCQELLLCIGVGPDYEIHGLHGQRFAIGSGVAVLLLPGSWYRFRSSPTIHLALGFHQLGPWMIVTIQEPTRASTWRFPRQSLLDHLPESCWRDPDARIAAVRRLLQWVLDPSHPRERFCMGTFLTMTPIGLMCGALRDHQQQGLNVPRLLRASGVGRSRAYELFSGFFGISPKQALEQARISMALQLVRAGLGNREVALRCGFSSVQHLRRAIYRWNLTHPTGTGDTGHRRSALQLLRQAQRSDSGVTS